MRLYHGSSVVIDKIDMSLSKVGKDFGCGFYLSPDMDQAEKMAATSDDYRSDPPGGSVFRPKRFFSGESRKSTDIFRDFVSRRMLCQHLYSVTYNT